MEKEVQNLNEINVLEDNFNIQSMKYPLLYHDNVKLKRHLKKNLLKHSKYFKIKTDKDVFQEEFMKLKIEERHKRESTFSILYQNNEKNKPKIKSQSPTNQIHIKINSPNKIYNKTQISFFSPNKKSRNKNLNELFKLTSYNSNDNFKTPHKKKIQKIYLNTIDSSNIKTNQSESFKKTFVKEYCKYVSFLLQYLIA